MVLKMNWFLFAILRYVRNTYCVTSQKLARHIKEGVTFKFFELPEAGHFNIESSFNDEVLEELLKFLEPILPEDVREQHTHKQFEIPGRFR